MGRIRALVIARSANKERYGGTRGWAVSGCVGMDDGRVAVLAPDELMLSASRTINARGEYLPRRLHPEHELINVPSPARVTPTGRRLADEFHRPGIAPETTKYTSVKGN